MATIKSYTDLEQSKKLAEILPIESADMEYMFLKRDGSEVNNVPFVKDGFEEHECCYIFIPCWSLATLRSSLPCGVNINNTLHVFESHNTFDGDWVYVYKFENSEPLYTKASNEIDACYEMIVKLHEQNIL